MQILKIFGVYTTCFLIKKLLFPSWLVWAEIKFTVHVALAKQPIN